MPGASNPVSSTPHGVPQSKSFRTRLGFGSSNGGGGGPSTKPSFFSFKPGRKSFGGSGELNHPVLTIDVKSDHSGTRQGAQYPSAHVTFDVKRVILQKTAWYSMRQPNQVSPGRVPSGPMLIIPPKTLLSLVQNTPPVIPYPLVQSALTVLSSHRSSGTWATNPP